MSDAPQFAATLPPELQMQDSTPSRRSCIRLRGLPDEAQISTIVEFLGEHAHAIVPRGVHMIYAADGQPSGLAFVEMNSEDSALSATLHCHGHSIMPGNTSYIEVTQCSLEEMPVVPMESSEPPSPSAKPSPPAPSPGFAMTRSVAVQTTVELLEPPRSYSSTGRSPINFEFMAVPVVHLRGLSPSATVQDVITLFEGFAQLTEDYVSLCEGIAGEALVAFMTRTEAELAVHHIQRRCVGIEVDIVSE